MPSITLTSPDQDVSVLNRQQSTERPPTLSSVNRKRPPFALDHRSLTARGLNKRDHAIPTPFASPRPEYERHDTQDRSLCDSLSSERGTADHVDQHTSHHDHFTLDALPLRFRQRLKHFTWTWFTMTMATGQLANVIYQIPFKFRGQYALGVTIFLFNICLFIFNVVMITIRFRLYPTTFKASFTHPTESLFVPAAIVSIGTIITNITEFGTDSGRTGEWLSHVMTVMFWIYGGVALAFSCAIYLIMWSTQTFTISQMTPVWIFPAYPLLVIGPHAGILSGRVTAHSGLDVIVGGFAFQGIGFMVSTMVYAAFLYRLMTNKLPTESLRPGMFISVGPSGFTTTGIINMGQNISKVIPADFMGVGELAGTITMVIANWVGIWLWGLAIFFLIVSVGAHYSCVRSGRMTFAMTWYSFVFPNTGLIAATFAVGKALNNNPIRIFGCVLVGILAIVYIFVFCMMIRAVVLRQILWPQKGEDRDEGGWRLHHDNDIMDEKTKQDAVGMDDGTDARAGLGIAGYEQAQAMRATNKDMSDDSTLHP